MNKRLRTGAIATAGVAAVAAAAILLPNANASTDQPAAPKTLSAHSATQLATSLKADLGDQSAGWYLDSSNGHLVMNVLSEDDAASVKAKGAVAKVVQNSMTALKSGAQTLRDNASVPGTAWSIDPKTNKIVVVADRTVTGAKMATLTKTTNGMGEGMVTVKRSQGEFKRYDGGDAGSAAGGAAGSAAGGAGDAAGGAGDAAGGAGDAAGGAGDAAGGAGDAAGGAGDAAGGAGDAAGGAGGAGDAAGGAGDAAGGAGDAAGGAGDGGAGGGEQAAGPIGGSAIFGGNARCSLGFNVTVKGAPAFLTAGHCGNDSKTWTADQGGSQPLGTVSDSQFPKTDFALVTYDDANAQPQSAVDLQNGSTQEITKAAEAAVGMKVQRSGSTTGLSDGTVTGLDATVNYGNGDIVNGLIQTDVCAEPGDSGGAMFSEDSAVGLTSGGSGDCTAGGETFFQPVTDALKATGAEIGAGGGGAGGDAGGDDAAAGGNGAGGGDAGAGNAGAGNAGAGNAGAGNAGAGNAGAGNAGAGAGDPGAGAQDPGAAGGDALN
ncbi:S1 family peptidase [Streptomyces sp. Je 1-4]|uniref:S1 family peptidase n=1 Tax=Streptomyces TaxID=1883 RepID=UPI0021D943F9|nr:MULTISPECIES: S1 family peptidase [unclassified Streptomyces]UYB44084.1 S1 family peptidase [Streptomyces sp. Je 1-4]UZQ40520.1 S1 family peptidase [Streptomyces sp. Je 1-4] [Streptomyces sp. Je 1-4 4N24]UZQ47937.1 S1 family peptidase [Streptomyces sp. Je 1-4] [Streptomyces sp. Je 1-4 4N24_ara]